MDADRIREPAFACATVIRKQRGRTPGREQEVLEGRTRSHIIGGKGTIQFIELSVLPRYCGQ
jgi:hypothetical protein